MGYIRHHAIIVTSIDDGLLERAHSLATQLEMTVTDITAPAEVQFAGDEASDTRVLRHRPDHDG